MLQTEQWQDDALFIPIYLLLKHSDCFYHQWKESLVLARPTSSVIQNKVSDESRYSEHALMYVCVVEYCNVCVVFFLVSVCLSVCVPE